MTDAKLAPFIAWAGERENMEEELLVTLNTAEALGGISRRTLWRRISDGSVRTAPNSAGNQTRVVLADVLKAAGAALPMACYPWLKAADAGEADAQCEVALTFLEGGEVKRALYWLRKAADQSCAEALYWRGRLRLGGQDGGKAPDEEGMISDVPADREGELWIWQASLKKHAAAAAALDFLRSGEGASLLAQEDRAALDDALEALDKRVTLDALPAPAARAL